MVPALDQVETSLRGRYLVRFPTPATLPATVSVKVDTGDLTLTGDALIPSPPPAAQPATSDHRALVWSLGGAAALVAVALIAFLLGRRARRAAAAARTAGPHHRVPRPGARCRARWPVAAPG